MKYKSLADQYGNMKQDAHDQYFHQQRLAVLNSLGETKPITEEHAKKLIAEFDVYKEQNSPFKSTIAGSLAQMKALDKLSHGNNKLIRILVFKFGEVFRKTIEEFKKEFHRIPTDDELIWIAGVHNKQDPRQIVADIDREISDLGGDDPAYKQLYKKYSDGYGEQIA